jgi:hypothetical protein
MTNSYQYSTIDHAHPEEITPPPFSQDQRSSFHNKKPAHWLILSGVVLMSGLAFATLFRSTSPTTDVVDQDGGAKVPMLGMAKPRGCTFKECFENSCNKEAAPFLCLRHNGGPHMGW